MDHDPQAMQILRLRVERVLSSTLSSDNSGKRQYRYPIELEVHTFDKKNERDGDVPWSKSENRRSHIPDLCRVLCSAFECRTDYLQELDNAYQHILECDVDPGRADNSEVLRQTLHLLTRLPTTPLPPGRAWTDLSKSGIEPKYFMPGAAHTWENLDVVRLIDVNVIRLAIVSVHPWHDRMDIRFAPFVNFVGTLFEAAIELPRGDSHSQLLQAFLWTSWQRAIMLCISATLNKQVQKGLHIHQTRSMGLDSMNLRAKGVLDTPMHELTSRYMCPWAFRLLHSQSSSIAMDFRCLRQRFDQVFGHLPPRCVRNGDRFEQCEGDKPTSCMRFKGMVIENQSAHAGACSGGCDRMFWDPRSFVQQSGGRAVSLNRTGAIFLRYCTASASTMAVSHVWSHGQGGRPEPRAEGGTGFNRCLHLRYATIATRFGCDSYWMDTPCIPQDHDLRKEEIGHINRIFFVSKMVLICDRDLMQIDASHLSMECKESILAVLLVCDWNVRAWTLLEAIRGRQNIWLLCKDDRTLCLRDIVLSVHSDGSLAIANFFLTAQHLLPAARRHTNLPEYMMLEKGFVNIEEAASLLSHRYASRPGDEVVIWSLLCDENPFFDAKEIWQARLTRNLTGRVVRTGFLMCSNPRVQENGLSWAPRRPDLDYTDYESNDAVLKFASNGGDTADGDMAGDGFEADWFACGFRCSDDSISLSDVESCTSTCSTPLSTLEEMRLEVVHRHLRGYKYGALLTPLDGNMLQLAPYQRTEAGKICFAVVGTNDAIKWRWKGLCEWPDSVQELPTFERVHLILD